MSKKEESKRSREASPKPLVAKTDSQSRVLEELKQTRLVIPEEGLRRIANHKYVPGAYTPIDNLFNEYLWKPLVEFLPRWLAPNAVTVTGLVILIIGYFVLAYHCTDFSRGAPRWVYVFTMFTVFAYQTLDALDGKQARRTQSSSPLGQLFDHGCDSVATVFLGMMTAMCLHLNFSVRCVLFIKMTLLPFWMAQWTEYHAHVLPTSIAGVVGVTEVQLVSMLIAIANVFDIDFWDRDRGWGSLPSWWCGRQTCQVGFNDVFVIAQSCIAIMGIAHCVHAVVPAARGKSALASALLQPVPIFLTALCGFAWCITIPHAHPRLVLFSLGMSSCHMTCKMIVAAMSRTEFSLYQSALLPLPVIYAVSLLKLCPRHDDVILGAYTAVTVYWMCNWVRCAIQEISQYIGIYTFRLGPRAKPKER